MTAFTRRLLLLLLALAVLPAALAGEPVEGLDYVRIENGTPWQPLDGQIEVAEIFSYACGVCDQFRPMLEAWAQRQAGVVRVSHIPAPYRPNDPFASAFFAALALDETGTTHAATFDAIHRRGILARNATTTELANLYAGLGVDRNRLFQAMHAPATAQQVLAARDFLVRSGARGTPAVIVNGRYRIQGETLHDVLRIADHLVAREREALSAPAQPPFP